MHGNPNIVKYGNGTRFGDDDGPDPSSSAKKKNKEQHPHSVRLALRRIMSFEIDVTQPMSLDQIAKAFGKQGVKLTHAQMCAIRKVHQAHQNWKAMDTLIDHVDGKQVQPVAEAKISLADLVAASYDKQLLKEPVEDDSDGDQESGS